MNTAQLHSLAVRDLRLKRAFEGVFAVDKIPRNRMLPSAMIINLSVMEDPGSHWVGFYEEAGKPALYFDSYGGKMPTGLCGRLGVCGSYIYNNTQFQSEMSSTCGQFALFFCMLACRGFGMKQIQNIFHSGDLVKNDLFVSQFINSLFNTKTRAFDESYLGKYFY